MTKADDAYAAALTAIRDATATGATELDLSGYTHVFRDLAVLPPEILELTSLQTLHLSSNNVTNITPLQDLASLQTLYLDSTRVINIEPLQSLTSLQVLELSGTQVADISPLHHLMSLLALHLISTRVAQIAPLQALASLHTLELRGTEVSDIEPLEKLISLQMLDLSDTQVANIAPLQHLTALRTLDLTGTAIQDLRPIRSLTNLVEGARNGGDHSGLHISESGAALNDPDGLGRLAHIKDNEERTLKVLDYLNGLPKDWTPGGPTAKPPDLIDRVTPPVDVEWTKTGHLRAELIAIPPEPRRAIPNIDSELQDKQLAGVSSLASQLAATVKRNHPHNAASLVDEIVEILSLIETETAKPAGQVRIVLVKANLHVLEALTEDAEALPTVGLALFKQFLQEAQRLLPLYPVLRQIDDPNNANIISEHAIPEGERFVEAATAVLADPDVEHLLGPDLPGVTRELMVYPWASRQQRIVNFAALTKIVLAALNDPPKPLLGLGRLAELVVRLRGAYEIIAPMIRSIL